MREGGWAALLLTGGSVAEEGALLAGTAALVSSALSSVGMRSRMTPLSSEGTGGGAARVTKACATQVTVMSDCGAIQVVVRSLLLSCPVMEPQYT